MGEEADEVAVAHSSPSRVDHVLTDGYSLVFNFDYLHTG